ncbi:MAG: hypothetical protein EOO65_01265 [Methanosarcinales archaeon]|nr:MAG: hypothetical protein EOO65_01265 [Methanosarcinales archaeon]
MGTGDDMEANASTFFQEMKEVAAILDTVMPDAGSGEELRTNESGDIADAGADPRANGFDSDSIRRTSTALQLRSLVLIDELGRGYAVEQKRRARCMHTHPRIFYTAHVHDNSRRTAEHRMKTGLASRGLCVKHFCAPPH